MQALLNDIELDVQELKCLIQSMLTDTNPVLRIVAKRNIHQMQERLDVLTKLLDDTFVITRWNMLLLTLWRKQLNRK